MMVSVGPLVSLVLLISLTIEVTDAIRTLKGGPMIDGDGREYKSVSPADNSRPKTREEPTVRVHCTEVSMIVFIQADFYRTGRLASPGELYLGDPKSSQNGRCYAVPAGDGEYVIDVDLHDCGSKLTVSDDDVIYSNNLIFSPAVGHHGITRVMEAVVPVSCHYKGKHTVSSITQQKQPLAFSASEKFPAGGSPFSLKLMTDDWSSEMFSNTFYLGDPLHLKASYSGPDSRQIFVDSCVATVMPDARSVPRYFFIENNGCFADAKDGGVNSLFLPRSRPDTLLFQLNAFLFHKELRTTIYLTCKLKASPELKSSPIGKACNYIQNRWTSVDGNDGVCWCCNRVCRNKSSKDDMICDTLTLGPLVIFPRN